MEKKEKKPDQVLGKKYSISDKPETDTTSVDREIFPWLGRGETGEKIDFNKYIGELAKRSPKKSTALIPCEISNLENYNESYVSKKKTESQSPNEEDMLNQNTNHLVSSEVTKYKQLSDSLKSELEEYKIKVERLQPEIKQYQNIINLLRAELKKYENIVPPNATDEISQYQRLIKSLRTELNEYKCKIEAMQPEITNYHQVINSLKSEISGYRHEKPQGVSNEVVILQSIINSLRTELAEFKNKIEIMSSERNQQNSIEALRTELAEFKNSSRAVQSNSQYNETMRSLNNEIARLKKNLDSMLLK
ncbi:MAG: hypothetical protein ABI340_10495 [Nitrososphaera sp.]